MEFRGISQYCTVKFFAELCEIKSILYKISYSAEFQKGTSEGTLDMGGPQTFRPLLKTANILSIHVFPQIVPNIIVEQTLENFANSRTNVSISSNFT